MNNNTSSTLTITTAASRTLVIEGIEEYRYEENGITIFLTRDLKSGIYVGNAVWKNSLNRPVESPFVLGETIDGTIDKVLAAIEWQSHRVPVQGQENDLHLVECDLNDDYVVHVYENTKDHPETNRYTGYVKWVDRSSDGTYKVRKLSDIVYGSTPDEVFDRAYESVQRQHYAYCGWYK